MKRIPLIVLVIAVALLIDGQAEAQRRIPHYQKTPAFSPYINLFRSDNAGLNSYVGSFQPSQRLRQFVSDTNSEFYYQQRNVAQESIRLSQEIAASTEQEPDVRPGLILRPTSTAGSVPRTAGGFLQHLRYFPNSPAAGGGANLGGRGGRGAPTTRGGYGLSGYGGAGGGYGNLSGYSGGVGIGGMAR